MMYKSARDANQDKCLRETALPCATTLVTRWTDACPDAKTPAWRIPKFDAAGVCTDKGTLRCQQEAPGKRGIYRSFSIRLSRTGPGGHRTEDTEFTKLKELVGAHPDRTILFCQVYVRRPWSNTVIDGACASLFDILALCDKNHVRTTAPDRGGFVSEFYYVYWDELQKRGCHVELWSAPSVPAVSKQAVPSGAALGSLFEEDV